MWPFSSKRTARREEIRRSRTEREGTWVRRWGGQVPLGWTSATFIASLAVALIVNLGDVQFGYRVGQTLPRALTARVPVELEDAQQTREMRIRTRDTSPNYYTLDVSVLADLRGRLTNALSLAKAHADSPDKVRELAAQDKLQLDEAGLAELMLLAGEADGGEYQRAVELMIQSLRGRWLVSPENPGIRRAATQAILVDPESGQQRILAANRLIFTNDGEAITQTIESAASAFPGPLQASVRSSIWAILGLEAPADGTTATPPLIRPLYRFDPRTLELAEQAAAQVPPQYIRYGVGDVLADAGPLTVEEMRLIRLEHSLYRDDRRVNASTAYRLEVLGRGLLAMLVVCGAAIFVSRNQKRLFRTTFRFGLFALSLIAVLGAARLEYTWLNLPPHAAVGLQGGVAALLAVIYYAHSSVFAISTALALLITLSVEQSASFLVVLMTAAGVFLYGLREVRNRGRIVLVGLGAAAATFAASFALAMVEGQSYSFALLQSIWAGGTTLLAAFIIEGVLPGLERVFGFSTGMTLLEWCDTNKPLLRTMAVEAPGTYNHSMLVGTLAEAACEAIGANGLLARAGAYYHDIGKINKAEYFVENQAPGVSRHERLSPAMSLLIIIGHVKDGIEMAREYALPSALRPFIAEHHGTTVVEFFYRSAARKRKPDDPAVSESEFRYPGPRPQTRETAILMLADGVEGAVRAMSEPTPGRIEQTVSEIVQKRLIDQQFDESDLTFRELAMIEAALVRTLCSIYHARIAYPSDEPRQAETQAS
jgi:putative nucleotidyltransferase with HDIG domain